MENREFHTCQRKFPPSGRKGKISYLPNVKKTGRKALYICVASNTLTHVCRIGLVALPYPKQCIIVSTRLSANKKLKNKKWLAITIISVSFKKQSYDNHCKLINLE
jgi:hypothetical protein